MWITAEERKAKRDRFPVFFVFYASVAITGGILAKTGAKNKDLNPNPQGPCFSPVRLNLLKERVGAPTALSLLPHHPKTDECYQLPLNGLFRNATNQRRYVFYAGRALISYN